METINQSDTTSTLASLPPRPYSFFPTPSTLSCNPSHVNPSKKSFSSLSALFSNPSALGRRFSKKGKTFAAFRDIDRLREEKPVALLNSLMKTLKENGVAGPILLRLDREFNRVLGEGAQFLVTGVSLSVVTVLSSSTSDNLNQAALSFQSIAIKKSRIMSPISQATGVSPSFQFQVRAIHREISALSHKRFQEHPHIVKLLGWGLDLDLLERKFDDTPIIPLLILERADCNLQQFLSGKHGDMYAIINSQDDAQIRYNLCRQICHGIGDGLGTLHSEGITHGDLKLENVLLFRTNRGWTPKLCDFGLSTEVYDSRRKVQYYGTPGWRAPEVMRQTEKPIELRSLKKCDIYAYGLVVRCVFAFSSHPPLSVDEENGGTSAFVSSSRAVRVSFGEWLRGPQLTRVIICLNAALQQKPFLRDWTPWRIFDKENFDEFFYPSFRAVDFSFASKLLRTAVHWLQLGQRHAYQAQTSIASYTTPLIFTIPFQSVKKCIPQSVDRTFKRLGVTIFQAKAQLDLYVLPFIRQERQKVYLGVFAHYMSLFKLQARPDTSDAFAHPTDGTCLLLETFYADLQRTLAKCSAFQRRLDDKHWAVDCNDIFRLYALARIRSRFRACCWERLMNSRLFLFNAIEDIVDGPHDLATLAWFCRGEVGRRELTANETNKYQSWRLLYDGVYSGGCSFRKVEDHYGPSGPNGNKTEWTCSHGIHDYHGCSFVKPAGNHRNRHFASPAPKHNLTLPERIDRFLLLLENGCSFQQHIRFRGRQQEKTVICRLFETFEDRASHESKDPFSITFRVEAPVDTQMEDLIRRFSQIAEAPTTSNQMRYFLTGRVPGDININTASEFVTTVLHQAVLARCYQAVACLLRSGFVMDVRDGNNSTALQLALIEQQKSLPEWEGIQNTRIIALLTQNQSVPPVAPLPGLEGLPLGWSKLYSTSQLTIYLEAYTHSITLIPPKFGILDDRSLALGNRRMTVDTDTYYLDLVHYLSSQPPDSRGMLSPLPAKFDDNWFASEAAEHQKLVVFKSQTYLARLPPFWLFLFLVRTMRASLRRAIALIRRMLLDTRHESRYARLTNAIARRRSRYSQAVPSDTFFSSITKHILEASRGELEYRTNHRYPESYQSGISPPSSIRRSPSHASSANSTAEPWLGDERLRYAPIDHEFSASESEDEDFQHLFRRRPRYSSQESSPSPSISVPDVYRPAPQPEAPTLRLGKPRENDPIVTPAGPIRAGPAPREEIVAWQPMKRQYNPNSIVYLNAVSSKQSPGVL